MKRVTVPMDLALLEYGSEQFEALVDATYDADLLVGVARIPPVSIAPAPPASAGVPVLVALQCEGKRPYLLSLSLPVDALMAPPNEVRSLALLFVLMELDRCLGAGSSFHVWADAHGYSADSRAAEFVFRELQTMTLGLLKYIPDESLTALIRAAISCAATMQQFAVDEDFDEDVDDDVEHAVGHATRLIEAAIACGNIDCETHGPLLRMMYGGPPQTSPASGEGTEPPVQ